MITPTLEPPKPALAVGQKTILLVEDDNSILSLFTTDLEEQGYKVLKAGSAPEALQICRGYTGPIHLLLTDIYLPANQGLSFAGGSTPKGTMNGLDLTRQVELLRPQIRVVLMSGQSTEGLKAFDQVRKGKPFLWKPVSTATLLRTVRETLGEAAKG